MYMFCLCLWNMKCSSNFFFLCLCYIRTHVMITLFVWELWCNWSLNYFMNYCDISWSLKDVVCPIFIFTLFIFVHLYNMIAIIWKRSYNLCWSVLWCKTSICCLIVTSFDIRLKYRINKEYLIILYCIVSYSSCQGPSLGCMAGDRPVRVHRGLGSGEYRRLWPRKHFTAQLSRLGRWRGHGRVREELLYPRVCFTSAQ